MKLGTKSVLFGAHQFILHPLYVLLAWWVLYGFPLHPFVLLSILLHDIGYIGKPNMDGPEGKVHPRLGAKIVGLIGGRKWYEFCAGHSRSYAKLFGIGTSKLYAADKLSMILENRGFYIRRAGVTGELWEYLAQNGACSSDFWWQNICRNVSALTPLSLDKFKKEAMKKLNIFISIGAAICGMLLLLLKLVSM